MSVVSDRTAQREGIDQPQPWAVALRMRVPLIGIGVLVAGAIASFALHVSRLATGPIRDSLTFVPDDAFYYLKVARSIANGMGPTFDGTNPTNGYHPGWMTILVGLARVVEDPVLLVRATQWSAFALHAGTAVLLGALLWTFSWRRWAVCSGAIWLCSPWGMVLAAQAMEAPLYQLAAVLLLLEHVLVATGRPGALTTGPLCRYGLALGLVPMARTDGVLLSALSLVLAAWRSRHLGTAGIARLGIAAAVALGMAIPWLVYSLQSCGTVFQDSAVMKRLWRAEGATVSDFSTFLGPWFGFPMAMLFGGGLYAGLGVAGKALVATVTILGWRSSLGSPPLRDVVILAVAWAVVSGLVFGVAVADIQLWHLVPPAVAIFVVVAGLAPAAASRINSRAAVALLAVWGAISLAVSFENARRGVELYPWQVDVYDSTAVFDRKLPENALVGSFNAGIPGYFSERRVTNLDGLINHEVVRYWRERRWNQYLIAAGVTHIADEEHALTKARRFSDADLQMIELARHPLTDWPGERLLWALRRENEPDVAR